MQPMRGWVLMIGALIFAVVMLLPFFVMAQEATLSVAPGASPDYMTVIAVAALAVSEALALIPQLKANGLLHMVILMLQKVLGRPVVPVAVLAVLAAGLSGCAAHKTPMVADVVSAAPFWCTLATSPAIDTAAGAIMAQVPKGTDQATAQKYVALALQIKDLTAPAACMLIKSYEAQLPAK